MKDSKKTIDEKIDESLQESFPASDPPSWAGGCKDGVDTRPSVPDEQPSKKLPNKPAK